MGGSLRAILISERESWYNFTMTIKKPLSKPAAEAPEAGFSPAAGGAAIADRFKLDLQDPAGKKGSSGGVAATVAAVAGFVALIVAGVLTFVIYQHWEFLQSA